ncbi:MAG: hypothetical protein IPH26_07560 [Sterolibacteriaceae bacterium]|uniref:Right handed beta helix domain-containing protein n=1 Tax=Candidatus Methylophosphatis roskildensis TaxID=2899263 RepID=A0A9D7E313_9PROT|nr:hypothetical protein [Candidatus Methylophosphatis roskildensis]
MLTQFRRDSGNRYSSLLNAVMFVSMLATTALVRAATLPAMPQTFDTTYSSTTGNVINVNNGGNLQSALNSAQLGDTIVLQAGATFTGPISLPKKTTGTGWIYIQSSAYSNLPAPGTRVGPTDAANMPKIVATSGGGTTVQTVSGAHHFRFVGIEFKPVSGNFLYNLISIGNGESSVASLPNNITFDRCYIHGDASVGGRRGVAMDGTYIAVVDSYISDFKEAGADTQALWAHSTPGPLKIVNNYLEAAGENVMFGGADPGIANVVPSDIEIRRNHFFKPLSWMGSSWSVKNLLEFKNARRALVEGNRFENNWAASQQGFSLLLTPRNQNGGAPWSAVQDITIRLNTFLNLGQGINVSGRDDTYSSQVTSRVLIQDNVINVSNLGSSGGRMFQLVNGPADVTIDHNTGFCTSSLTFAENSPKADGFLFQNNLVTEGDYGFTGTGSGNAINTLNTYFTNWQFLKNAIIGGSSSNYPTGNYFPSGISSVGFANYSGGNYHLAATSSLKGLGTDGKDIGANIDAVTAAASVSAVAPPPVSIPSPPKGLSTTVQQ